MIALGGANVLKRKTRGGAVRALRAVNRQVLHPIDLALASPTHQPLEHSIVFMLGPPRSGSTLITQVLTNALDIGYLSNKHCRFFGAPALAERWFRPLGTDQPSDYASDLGGTVGTSAPSECGDFWYRFFRTRPSYVTARDAPERKMAQMRRSIASLICAMGKPLLIKNLFCALRLQPIISALPEALFIVVQRDEVDNGQSLLRGRMSATGAYDRWWSAEPPNIAELRPLPPHAQVVEQIRSIRRLIDSDLAHGGVDSNRVHRISYEGFCDDVTTAVVKVKAFLAANGVAISGRFSVPRTFPRHPRECRIDRQLYDNLVKYCGSQS